MPANDSDRRPLCLKRSRKSPAPAVVAHVTAESRARDRACADCGAVATLMSLPRFRRRGSRSAATALPHACPMPGPARPGPAIDKTRLLSLRAVRSTALRRACVPDARPGAGTNPCRPGRGRALSWAFRTAREECLRDKRSGDGVNAGAHCMWLSRFGGAAVETT